MLVEYYGTPNQGLKRVTHQLQRFHLKRDNRIGNDQSVMVDRYRLEQTVGSPTKDEAFMAMPRIKN